MSQLGDRNAAARLEEFIKSVEGAKDAPGTSLKDESLFPALLARNMRANLFPKVFVLTSFSSTEHSSFIFLCERFAGASSNHSDIAQWVGSKR